MMAEKQKISGVILAGGLARRMNYQDKGLISFRNKPMISYAISAMSAIADPVIINANRNIEQYQKFNLPVITDQRSNFDGPLAGILAAMKFVQTPVLIVMPCDSPLILPSHLQKLSTGLAVHKADIAVAFDGNRMHPIFLALKTNLQNSLQDYLANNGRKVESWLQRHKTVLVEFKDGTNVFANINSINDLIEFEIALQKDMTI